MDLHMTVNKYISIAQMGIFCVSLSSVECPEETSEGEFTFTWRKTVADRWQSADCPNDPNIPPATARRHCDVNGVWERDINTADCISPALANITNNIQVCYTHIICISMAPINANYFLHPNI